MLDSRPAAVHDRHRFTEVLRAELATGDRLFGNSLVVLRAVDGSDDTDAGLPGDLRRAAALLAGFVEAGRPVGQLSDDVFAVALVGHAAPDGRVLADRLERAVRELHRLSPALADLAIAVSIVEITGYEIHDLDTALSRAIEVVEAEQLWVERARSATLHLVDAAATLHLLDG